MKTFWDCVSVGAGGLFGSIMRYLICLLPLRQGKDFPILTLGVNVIGAFLIGLIVAFAGKDINIDPRTLLFLKVGVCGGFTTFSTFALEAKGLLDGGKAFVGLIYITLSVVLCIVAVTTANSLVK